VDQHRVLLGQEETLEQKLIEIQVNKKNYKSLYSDWMIWLSAFDQFNPGFNGSMRLDGQ